MTILNTLPNGIYNQYSFLRYVVIILQTILNVQLYYATNLTLIHQMYNFLQNSLNISHIMLFESAYTRNLQPIVSNIPIKV